MPGLLLQVPGAGGKAGPLPRNRFRALYADDVRGAAGVDAFAVEDDFVGVLYRSLEGPDGTDALNVFRSDNVGSQGCGSRSGNSTCDNQYGCDAQ